MSVKSLNEEFVTYLTRSNLRANTIEEYSKSVAKFQSWLKDYLGHSFLLDAHILNVSVVTSQEYAFQLRDSNIYNLSVNSTKKEIAGLQKYYKVMVRLGKIKHPNPTEPTTVFDKLDITHPKDSPKKVFMRVEEGFSMVEATDNPEVAFRLKLFVNMGFRTNELVSLEVDNFNLEDGTVSFIRKNQKWDTQQITPSILEEVKAHVTTAKAKGQKYLFENKNTGKPLSTMAITKNVKSVASKLGYIGKQFTNHGLRAVCANNLRFNHGFKEEEVQEILGHTSVTTTKIYLNAHKDMVMKKVANM